MKRWTTLLHATVYRVTRGRLLGRMGGQAILLLETRGRRTGRCRVTPLQYVLDGTAFVVVASNAGARRPPAWYLNLRAEPHARVRTGARIVEASAHEARGDPRRVLWRRLTRDNRYLERAAGRAGRELPVMVLIPRRPMPQPSRDA
jgi:F420H(2)-dependent quinone reductase